MIFSIFSIEFLQLRNGKSVTVDCIDKSFFPHNPIGTWAKKTGLEYNMSLLKGTAAEERAPPSAVLTAQYMVANTVVFKKVKAALGLDRCKRFFSAAAPASR